MFAQLTRDSTVSEFCEAWLAEKVVGPVYATATQQTYGYALQIALRLWDEDLRLRDWNITHIEQFITHMINMRLERPGKKRQGYSPATVQIYATAAWSALTDAASRSLVDAPPLRRPKVPSVPQADYDVPTSDELLALVHAAGPDTQDSRLIYFLFVTCLRIGEAAALTIEDVDLDHWRDESGTWALVTVSKQRVVYAADEPPPDHVDAADIWGPTPDPATGWRRPKSASAFRRIMLAPAGRDVLLEQMRHVEAAGKKQGRRFSATGAPIDDGHSWVDRGLLWPGKRGGVLSLQMFRLRLRRFAALAGFAGRLTPHTLRHAGATWALQQGAQLIYVQKMLGHATTAQTARYLHPNHEGRIEVAAALATALPRRRTSVE